jgi:class 3 adenylate cyclase
MRDSGTLASERSSVSADRISITASESVPRSSGWWLDATRAQERRGELLSAFDLAERGLGEHPHDLALMHRAVLALARTGATPEAQRRFEQYRLAEIEDSDEDVAALHARLAKDTALNARGHERARLANHAARLYYAVFTRTGGYYPAINAATLWLVAGYGPRSQELAGIVLDVLASNRVDSYYQAATRAEAHLLRGELDAAARALADAARMHGGDHGATSTTRRQLRLICALLAVDNELLAPLAGPGVVHFCGHRIAEGRFAPAAETTVAGRIAEAIRDTHVGYAYGSLACGADILWAEAVLAAEGELHVVLPFARDEFLAWSVRPAGPGWVERFEACLAAASSVRFATDDAFLGDDVLFSYCSELAMGLALLRGRYLDAEVRQLVVWDGGPAAGAAGTAIDIATWRRTGRPVTVISPTADAPRVSGLTSTNADRTPGSEAGRKRSGRIVRALLFGDVRGFSTLTDEQLPLFTERFLGAFADVLAEHREHIWHTNTWGDAVYVVLSDADAAAACALDLQASVAAVDLASSGLPAHLALRLGGHVGPVFQIQNPVLRARAFMGSHVSRTARIEPITPPGEVYVTEPFAAALVLAEQTRFSCDYVGHMPLAKDYGRLRMYRLRNA